MTIAFVQQKEGSIASGTSGSVTLPSAPTVGNTLIFQYLAASQTQPGTPTDATGLTWARGVQSNTNGNDVEIWMATVGAGASATIGFTIPSFSVSGVVNVFEVSNTLPLTFQIAACAANTGTSTTPTSATVTPTSGASALCVAATRKGGSLSSGPTNSYTALTTPNASFQFAYKIIASASGTTSTGWTFSSSTAWDVGIVTLLETAATAALPQPPSALVAVRAWDTAVRATVPRLLCAALLGSPAISANPPVRNPYPFEVLRAWEPPSRVTTPAPRTRFASINTAPGATITSPATFANNRTGQSVAFAGSGTDAQDGALSGSSLAWTSSIDGAIGTGTSFSKSNLTAGKHLITLVATDSGGLTGSATAWITIDREFVVPYYAKGIGGADGTVLHQQYSRACIPTGTPPIGGWPVALSCGGSGERKGTGVIPPDNDNTTQVTSTDWWCPTIYGNPTDSLLNSFIWVFVQNVDGSSPNATTHYQHFMGLLPATIEALGALYPINHRRIIPVTWSQGSYYTLGAANDPIFDGLFAGYAFAAGRVLQAVSVLFDAANTDANLSAAYVARQFGQKPIRQYQGSADVVATPTEANRFRDAEYALPNANYPNPKVAAGGYVLGAGDHQATGQALVADRTDLLTWLLTLELPPLPIGPLTPTALAQLTASWAPALQSAQPRSNLATLLASPPAVPPLPIGPMSAATRAQLNASWALAPSSARPRNNFAAIQPISGPPVPVILNLHRQRRA